MKKNVFILLLSIGLSSCATLGPSTPYPGESTTETGVRYLLGHGVKKDDAKAFHYFTKAADEDDALAQNELGFMYAAGKGTPQNWEKSYYWYEKAAQHGLASAEYNTGLFYYYGIGGKPMDRSKGLFWFKKAADHGFEPAKAIFAKGPIQ